MFPVRTYALVVAYPPIQSAGDIEMRDSFHSLSMSCALVEFLFMPVDFSFREKQS